MPKYHFVQWEDGSTNRTRTVNVTSDMALIAYYEEEAVVTHTLTVAQPTNGTTNPAPGLYSVEEGQVQEITAIPDSGYQLNHWELDGVNVGKANPYPLTMDADHTLVAVFSLKTVTAGFPWWAVIAAAFGVGIVYIVAKWNKKR